ncbi:MAG: hypothetical protein JSV99_04755 [Planctomycetota bacterium]|nr:MAG: hypothetical protein JSV99_04755 [Planctomycetota bacterium]
MYEREKKSLRQGGYAALVTRPVRVVLLSAVFAANAALAGVIDFETLPDGTPTYDGQTIFAEYEAVYGVTFTLLNRNTGEPIGFPIIAKAGAPQTAFLGCSDYDAPLPMQGLGASFLTDDQYLGMTGDLLISYTIGVSSVSGVIIDTDCRDDGGPPCEQWTITARDANDQNIAETVIDAPTGPGDPQCINPDAGPGDGAGITWSFDVNGPNEGQIYSVLIRYTGSATDAGIAFDNFSPSTLAPAPAVTVSSHPWNKICLGETIELSAEVSGGTLPLAYQWQEEVASETWMDLGTEATEQVSPQSTTSYRVIVTDAETRQATSDPFVIGVCQLTPDLDGDGCIDMIDFAIFAAAWLNGCD